MDGEAPARGRGQERFSDGQDNDEMYLDTLQGCLPGERTVRFCAVARRLTRTVARKPDAPHFGVKDTRCNRCSSVLARFIVTCRLPRCKA